MQIQLNNNNYKYLPALEFTATGSGSPVFLLHGIAASRYDWTSVIPELSKHGYRCLAPDLLGHGDSPKPGKADVYNIQVLYHHFESWFSATKPSQPAVLIGHSMGGYLSLLHTLYHPAEVRALILVDPLFSPWQLSPLLHWLKNWPELGRRTIRRVPEWLVYLLTGLDSSLQNNTSDKSRQRIAADYKRASPNIMLIPRTINDLSPYMKNIDHPVLVIWGRKDRTLSPYSFYELLQMLPNAKGHVFPNSGHQPHIAETSQFNQVVLDYLGKIL